MSRAFTKEDDAGGVTLTASGSFVVPSGPFLLTARGAQRLAASPEARLRDLLARATLLPPAPSTPDRAALGVTVHVRTPTGEARSYRLVPPAEQALTGEGCSIQSPLGRALLGAEVGESREVRTPRGNDELEIVALDGD